MPMFADTLRSLHASVVVIAIIIAGLVYGRELLIPLAVATIIAFILAPIVERLVRLRVPEGLAVSTTVAGLIIALGALSLFFSSQLLSLTAEMNTYRFNIAEKVRVLSDLGQGDSMVKRAADAIQGISTAIERELKPALPAGSAPPPPVPPEAGKAASPVPAAAPPANFAFSHLSEIVHPLAQVALTMLLTLFLLLQHQDLRDRVVRVAGTDNLSGTTAAMSDAGRRLSRVFLAQAALNAGFGIFIGLALWLIGVPNPILWGTISFVMRFVPFIGSFIAAVPPVLVAAGVDTGWTMPIATLLLFVVAEPIAGNVIEPLVLGKQAGLSPFALIVATGFWTLVWGPVGLLLAAPLTLVVVVLGRYVSGLEFVSVMLGDEAPLEPPDEFYRRLLSGNPHSVVRQANTALDEGSVASLSDTIVLPALVHAANDHGRGRLPDERVATIASAIREVEGLFEPSLAVTGDEMQRAVVIPARGPIDTIAAEYLATTVPCVTRLAATRALTESAGLTALSQLKSETREAAPDVVVLVTVGGTEPRHLALMTKRASQLFDKARILVFAPDIAADDRAFADTGAGVGAGVTVYRSIASIAPILGCEPMSDSTPSKIASGEAGVAKVSTVGTGRARPAA